MAKSAQFDVIVVGAGPAAALTALAMAAWRRDGRAARRSVGLLQPAAKASGHVAAASYTFWNPRAGSLLSKLKVKLSKLADGSFSGMAVIDAPSGRRAEFRSRSISGYLVDGPRLTRSLLGLCRRAGVRQIAVESQARVQAGDDDVTAVWPGGRCAGRMAVLAELDPEMAAMVEGLGLRHLAFPGQHVRCLGLSIPASRRQIARAFGPKPQLLTIWLLRSLGALGGQSAADKWRAKLKADSHAWVMARKDRVSVGLMLQWAGEGPGRECSAADAERLMDDVLDELRSLDVLPGHLAMRTGPLDCWQMPLASALELESHAGKRSLAVGLAGGFSAALSGQWLYPSLQSAILATAVIDKALAEPRPQDVLCQFDARWRQRLADYLRRPNTQLPFLLPLVLSNQQIAERFCRSYLFGESF